MSKLKLDTDSTIEDYKELLKLEEGDVFEVCDDFDTIMERIEEVTPRYKDFEVFPITPGTDLYVIYGCNHCVVIANGLNPIALVDENIFALTDENGKVIVE